ncbi:General transcription and DNA repair factor IIH subunit tfb5 [Penicillium frequentans]|nr:General transcription and DNA repair factor IIH subunit tfb5 [Penicillium glabrum]
MIFFKPNPCAEEPSKKISSLSLVNRLSPPSTSPTLDLLSLTPSKLLPTTTATKLKMPRAVRGLLIECDPSIKSMILKYDEERHDYIVEDLDDENHLVIKESQLENLKARLDHDLDEKIMQLDESESE